jgi:hypothetical protein
VNQFSVTVSAVRGSRDKKLIKYVRSGVDVK